MLKYSTYMITNENFIPLASIPVIGPVELSGPVKAILDTYPPNPYHLFFKRILDQLPHHLLLTCQIDFEVSYEAETGTAASDEADIIAYINRSDLARLLLAYIDNYPHLFHQPEQALISFFSEPVLTIGLKEMIEEISWSIIHELGHVLLLRLRAYYGLSINGPDHQQLAELLMSEPKALHAATHQARKKVRALDQSVVNDSTQYNHYLEKIGLKTIKKNISNYPQLGEINELKSAVCHWHRGSYY
jgi:hypothetical protein